MIRINAPSPTVSHSLQMLWKTLMTEDYRVDIMPVVDEIVEIARTTHDPETARLLIDLAHRLLTEAGLPPDENRGGGELPNGWVSDLAEASA